MSAYLINNHADRASLAFIRSPEATSVKIYSTVSSGL